MDEIDRAEQAEQWARDMAIAAARQQKEPRQPGRTHCIDCQGLIPAKRQEFGASRCVECQGDYEQHQQRTGG